MARKKKDNLDSWNKSLGYSDESLKALKSGTYDQWSGDRNPKYNTSGEQLRQSRELPVLKGISQPTRTTQPDEGWSSSFGRGKGVDTVGARRKYEQKIGHFAPDARNLRNRGYESSYTDIDFSKHSPQDLELLEYDLEKREGERKRQEKIRSYEPGSPGAKFNEWANNLLKVDDADDLAFKQAYINTYGKSRDEVLDAYKIYKESQIRKEREEHPYKTALEDIKTAPDRAIANAAGVAAHWAFPDSDLDKMLNSDMVQQRVKEVNKNRDYTQNSTKLTQGQKTASKILAEGGDFAADTLVSLLSGTPFAMGDAAEGIGVVAELAPWINTALTGVLGYGEAAGSTKHDLEKQGLDDTTATELANAAGLLNAGGRLATMMKGATAAGETLLKRVLESGKFAGKLGVAKQSLSEAANAIILGNQGTFNNDVQNYLKQGLSQTEAGIRATLNLLGRIGGAGAIEGLSGAAYGLLSGGVNNIANRVAGNEDLNSVWAPMQNAIEQKNIPYLTGPTEGNPSLTGSGFNAPALPDNIYPIPMSGTNGVINLPGETAPIQLPDLTAISAPKYAAESAAKNPMITSKPLTGNALKQAKSTVSTNKKKIQAIRNEISILENDKSNYRNNKLKKAVEKTIKGKKNEITALKEENKKIGYEIKGELAPVKESITKEQNYDIFGKNGSVNTSINFAVRFAGNTDEAKALGNVAKSAIRRYVNTGSKEDLKAMYNAIQQLDNLAQTTNADYVTGAGNTYTYGDYFSEGANYLKPVQAVYDMYKQRASAPIQKVPELGDMTRRPTELAPSNLDPAHDIAWRMANAFSAYDDYGYLDLGEGEVEGLVEKMADDIAKGKDLSSYIDSIEEYIDNAPDDEIRAEMQGVLDELRALQEGSENYLSAAERAELSSDTNEYIQALAGENEDAIYAIYDKLNSPDFKPITFTTESGATHIIHKSTRSDAKWQLSTIRDTGEPFGHSDIKTDDELLKSLADIKGRIDNLNLDGETPYILKPDKNKTTIGELIANPSAYTKEDFDRAIRTWDHNADPDESTLEEIVEFLTEEVANDPGLADMSVVMPPKTSTSTPVNTKELSNANAFLSDEDTNDYLRAGNHGFHQNRYDAMMNGEPIMVRSAEELENAITNIIATDKSKLTEMQPIGVMRVSENVANQLKELDPSVDASKYFFQLEPNDVWHAYNGHKDPQSDYDLPMSPKDMVSAISRLNEAKVVDVIQEKGKRKLAKLIIPGGDNDEYYSVQVISKGDGALSLKTLMKIKKGSMDAIEDSKSPNAIRSHTTSNNNVPSVTQNVKAETPNNEYWLRILGDDAFLAEEAQKQGTDPQTLRRWAKKNLGYGDDDDINPPSGGGNVPPEPPKGGNGGGVNQRERGMSKHMRGEGRMQMADVPDEVKEDFINNPDMYKVLTNASTQEKADDIYRHAVDPEAEFRKLLLQKDPAALPLGHQIARDYSAAGDYDMAAQIYRDMGEKLTEAGQFSQAAVLAMMKDDPMTALQFAEKEISKLNAEGKKRFGDKWNPFELTPDEIDAFRHINPGDSEAIQEVFDQIGQRIGRDYPTTFMEKLLEGRKIAMLFNPRTVSRNFLANPPTLAMRWVSDRIEALGQEIVHIIDPSFEKTQAITGSGIKGRKLAKQYLESEAGQRLINGTTGKYEVPDIKGALTKDKQMYKGTAVSKWVDRMTNGGIQRLNESLFDKKGVQSIAETIRNVTYGLLELGDNPFVKENFVERLGSYIHAKGIKNVEDIPEEAVMLAWEEAMKATYKDDSWAVNLLNKTKKGMESVPVIGRPLSQATIPFVQAPGNISARMVDYSGIRGTKGIADVISGAQKGDADKVRRGIEEISKGLTGMLGIAAGMALYKSGIITGDVSDNVKKKAFEQMDGFKAWALHVGDKYFKYDWAQPGAEQLIIGTLLQQAIDNSDEYDSDILRYFGIEGSKVGKVAGALTHGVKSSVNSWFDQSSLQGLMDLMKGNSGQSTDMAQNIVDVGVSDFAGALVPAVGNATAKTLDTTARMTTDPSNTFATFLNQQAAKIPGLSKMLPAKYDVWGDETKYANSTAEAFFQRFFVPGEYGSESNDPVNKEIKRIFDEVQDEKVFPFYAAKKVGDKQLNNKEVSEYQKDMGQRSRKMAEAFIDSDRYKNMSDEERTTALYNMYQTSKIITERDLFDKPVPDNSTWKKYVQAYDNAGGGEKGVEAVVNFSEARSSMKAGGLTSSSNLGKEVEKAAAKGDTKKVEDITNAAQSVEDLGFTKVGPKETYVKAKSVDPSMSLEEFAKTYRDIDANGNQGITQKEVIDYLNANKVPELEGMNTWNKFAPNGKKTPYIKKDGTWGTH